MALPYWRLSAFYFFFFATLGALLPYWGVYLKDLGYTPAEIGELFAAIMATKIIAPNIWGWVADVTGQRLKIIRIASLVAVVAFCGVFIAGSYWWLLLVMAAFSFFWNASLPQFEAHTMTHLGGAVQRYSRVRLWGSVGFIVSVLSLGSLMEWYGSQWLPWVISGLLAAIWLSSLWVPNHSEGPAPYRPGKFKAVLLGPGVLALLAVSFLMQASHGPYYTFFSIYLQEKGYGADIIGLLWALGVLAEIMVFLYMTALTQRHTKHRLLLLSLLFSSIRWLLIAWGSESLMLVVMAQLLHAATFGVFHAVVISYIHEIFKGSHQGRGQALYSSLSFGAGGALGSLMSGYLWVLGGAWVYTVSAGLSLLAFILAAFFLQEKVESN